MGLRLYQAPVESDIQSRPTAEKSPAQARSIIRRSRLSRNSERERRRRLIVGLEPRRRSPPLDAPTGTSVLGDTTGASGNPEGGRHALRDMAGRMGILDERVVAMFGERWAHLHAESNSPLRDDQDHDPSPLSAMAVEPEFYNRRRRAPPAEPYTITEPYAMSNMRSTQAPNRLPRNPPRPSAGVRIRRTMRPREASPPFGADLTEMMNFDRSHNLNRRRGETQPPHESAPLDGLGDRNRSLSPEGDHAWDTLLSTLTPDPQPPSVGTSFASSSAVASATASQSAATRSSATSFTGPDTIEESAFEPPCESGCENSDTEGDEGDEAEQNPLTRFPSGLGGNRRSYADVTRNNGPEDPLELLGDITSLQLIVRTLASRDDIPDEWWSEVGFIRNLPREASTN
ncbi:hypothetical protein B0H66DRAFT_162074 [Apodospora peruviana]|uniref:Uncharacterized protein n=1 Tax=Apodospora peruviana TaxID=516989 RepID=A0AAE0IKL2_9PEZI|nr:hypothetical protein B0H66DRAFT_162074 [Apodospora peruviana]